MQSSKSTRSQVSIKEKIRNIRKEKGQQVIAKLTSKSHVVERKFKVRKECWISRHYVPEITSVHHTVPAYYEAMAEPGYCITMEGADATAENMMLDLRKAGKKNQLRRLNELVYLCFTCTSMASYMVILVPIILENSAAVGSSWELAAQSR